jgi:hypothetical protein
MQTLLDPAILFFIFGLFAGAIKSNLEIPPAISRFLSLYLLMALGLKGGFALAKTGLTIEVGTSLGAAIFMAILVPLIAYQILKRFVSGFDAAAIAATYGSVSAVTFITSVQYLETHSIAYGGYMAAAMALMESPAIILAVVLSNSLRKQNAVAGQEVKSSSITKILHESFTDGAQLLLMGAMVVGMLSGAAGEKLMAPFSVDLFKGMLAFFLLDMGLMAARRFPEIRGQSPWLIAYALLASPFHAALALALASVLGLSAGDGGLLMVLSASASYIAVPAALRFTIPEANPSLYFSMSLGVTFPFNILLGIPLYMGIAQKVLA